MTKYLIFIGIILVVASGATYYHYREVGSLRAMLELSNRTAQEAKLEIGRANTKLADANQTISLLTKEIQEEIRARKADIETYGKVIAEYKKAAERVKVITKIVYRDREQIVELPMGKLYMRISDRVYEEITALQWKYQDFRITLEGDCIKGELSYKLHQKFQGQFVETKLPTGAYNHYLNIWETDESGKKVGQLQLTSFEVIKRKPDKNTFKFINPKLDLGLSGGVYTSAEGTWMGDIGVSLSSHGATVNDLRWRFIRASAGLTNNGFSLNFSPVQYNLGSVLPLISNLWATPYAGYDFTHQQFHFGLGISVVL